jgi:hypothetical protein
MNKPSYKACQQIHFNKRMRQRLHIDFNRHKTHEIILQITEKKNRKDNSLTFYKKAFENRQWWKGKINGTEVYFLFDKNTKRIVTVLTEKPR